MSIDLILILNFSSFGFNDVKKVESFNSSRADSGVAGTDGGDGADSNNVKKPQRKRTAMAMTNGDVGGASPILPGPSGLSRRRLEFK